MTTESRGRRERHRLRWKHNVQWNEYLKDLKRNLWCPWGFNAPDQLNYGHSVSIKRFSSIVTCKSLLPMLFEHAY